MKLPILIDRSSGGIPGLIVVNEYLAEHFGVVVAAVTDEPVQGSPDAALRWVGCQLRQGVIRNGNILPGAIICDGGAKST